MTDEELLRFHFAMQNFARLAESEAGREIMFQNLIDKNTAIRAKILKHLNYNQAVNKQQQILFLYGQANYLQLREYCMENADMRGEIIKLLKTGAKPSNNSTFHCKQCLFLLQQIDAMEDTATRLKVILNKNTKQKNRTVTTNLVTNQNFLPEQPIQIILDRLNQQGIYVNNTLIFPEIAIRTITNRITYRNPNLQGWSKEKREREIAAPAGCKLLKYDFISMEPVILINILLSEFLLALQDIPQEDIYLAINPKDRPAAKLWLNRIINGGSITHEFKPTEFSLLLVDKIQEWRTEIYEKAYKEEFVETLGGRQIGINRNETNFSGKAVNRIIQGSASDIFQHALQRLDELIAEDNLDTRLYFLLHDEIWLASAQDYSRIIKNTLESISSKFNFIYPLKVRERSGAKTK